MPLSTQLVIDPRYQGFPDNTLGGYVGGLLANMLGGSVEVTFRGPVPASQGLELESPDPGLIVLSQDGEIRAEARSEDLELEVPAPVSLAEAAEAASAFPGFEAHPFPDCFTCGPDRETGDGLRVFPGPVAGRELVAAPWTPAVDLADAAGTVRPEFVWSALDCPQLWALIESTPADSDERVVTAAMTVRIDSPLEAGAPHLIAAWPIGRKGRAMFAGAAVFSEHGELEVAALQRAVVVPGRGVPLGTAQTVSDL
jgi:hypothetical protein